MTRPSGNSRAASSSAFVSAVELRATTFFAGVRDVIERYELRPSFLEIELTETLVTQDWKATAEVLRSLKTLGVRIALDDFGTGQLLIDEAAKPVFADKTETRQSRLAFGH